VKPFACSPNASPWSLVTTTVPSADPRVELVEKSAQHLVGVPDLGRIQLRAVGTTVGGAGAGGAGGAATPNRLACGRLAVRAAWQVCRKKNLRAVPVEPNLGVRDRLLTRPVSPAALAETGRCDGTFLAEVDVFGQGAVE
jgi:hypothetical protein